MPAEVAVFLIVVVGAIWLVVKVFVWLGTILDDAQNAYTRGQTQRHLEKKRRLSQHVRVVLPNELDWAQKKLDATRVEFAQFQRAATWTLKAPSWEKKDFQDYKIFTKREAHGEMDVEDIQSILAPNPTTWTEEEVLIFTRPCKYPSRPPVDNRVDFGEFFPLGIRLDKAIFEYDTSMVSEKVIARYFGDEQRNFITYNKRRFDIIDKVDALNRDIQLWNAKARLEWEDYAKKSVLLAERELTAFNLNSERYIKRCEDQKSRFLATLMGYESGAKSDVLNRLDYVLGSLQLPHSVPHTWEVDFDEEERILIVEIGLPDVVHRPPFKRVLLKSGPVRKPLNQTEKREIVPQVHPAILLRVACEVFRNDVGERLNLLVVNGWIRFDDPRTGENVKAYTASLLVERSQIVSLNLGKIEPLVAFESLHGKSAGKLAEIVPIEPALSLNKKDSRFVDAKEVLNTLGSTTNLAAMDWQDFEHLIRELFEKEFSGRGAEVKITQASRDRGVDAIVFDPDPIRGGKYVIQAKRYTNTVDVSAVRDLCAVVRKEGASKGILVATSTYGSDAYAFANNEPVTLLNGAELLGLLRKHGYSFRINLQEARQLGQLNMRRDKGL